MTHFNIGKKIEVNPFEDVKYVVLGSTYSSGAKRLEQFLHKNATQVVTKKIGDRFYMCFDVELLDFTTLLKWIAPYRGTFQIGQSQRPPTVHFSIEKDIMSCW